MSLHRPIHDKRAHLSPVRPVTEVARGEIVGLIEKNGAGKSVLLKILAHIAKPTKDRAQLLGHSSGAQPAQQP
jgi:ABC-type multidrug transport system ATPase subunit